jgi:spermidine synthase
MPKLAAALLVFVSSAAVLVIEILAGRMLAPYVGVSIDTYTAVIGTMLAGIAAGSAVGGVLADRWDPRRLLAPLLILGGALALATVPVVDHFGPGAAGGGNFATLKVAVFAFFLPGLVLSAVTPTIIKLQLHSLDHTGGVVGRMSAIGTLGALVGTFVTGYLLIATTPTSTVIVGMGCFLVTVGVVLFLVLSHRMPALVIVPLVLAAGVSGAVAVGTSSPCDRQSAYYCMRVEKDFRRPTGRTLYLDNLEHSYVDLKDPTFVSFEYVRTFTEVIGAAYPDRSAPLRAVHVGGGGFTLPRWMRATYPRSHNVVLEIDPSVRDLAEDELGLVTDARLQVQIGDGRQRMRAQASNSADVIVGDAFGSLSVPWHLTTREYVADVDRVLREDGIYLVNVIDAPPFKFARAELATLRERFEFVAAIAPNFVFENLAGANVVLVASHRQLDVAQLRTLAEADVDQLVTGAALDRFLGHAEPLRDDYAPVDQWLADAVRG